MKIFKLPDIGEGLQDAEIVSWHVSVGDHVVADQPLLAVETDKAVVELPSPYSGTIRKLHGAVGDIVTVGAPLVEFDDGEDRDVGAIVGELATESKPSPSIFQTPRRATADSGTRGKATPAVRAYAKARNVDISVLVGSGPGGIILKSDVDAVGSKNVFGAGFEPLKGARRAMASNMARAGRTVVPATVTELADVTAWWGRDINVTAKAIHAVASAALEEPSLNAWFDGTTPSRKLHRNVDIGLAVDTPDGLFVPVLRDVANLEVGEIDKRIEELLVKSTERKLTPDDLRGPTITVSNFGSIGGRHAQLVIMPPQVAIVGIGRIEADLRFGDGSGGEGKLLPLSLTFDHRAVTGGEAARFLNCLKQRLTDQV